MDEYLYERIKQYQSGQLPEADRLAFEQQLATDPAFADEVAAWAAVHAGIQEKGDAELNRQLTDLGRQLLRQTSHTTDSPLRRRHFPRWAYAAAAAILLLLLAWPLYQRLSRPQAADPGALYAAYFHPLQAPALRDAAAPPWQTAYQKQQYPAAIAALQTLLADTAYARRAEAQLFLGISYLAAGQAPEALAAFDQVSNESISFDEAQWFSALAYLKQNDPEAAKRLLQSIANQAGHSRRTEAGQLLQQLNE